jgi:hypothetical protein
MVPYGALPIVLPRVYRGRKVLPMVRHAGRRHLGRDRGPGAASVQAAIGIQPAFSHFQRGG